MLIIYYLLNSKYLIRKIYCNNQKEEKSATVQYVYTYYKSLGIGIGILELWQSHTSKNGHDI